MKKLLLGALGIVLSTQICFAQAPESFNYQAIVRDAQGNTIPNATVSFRLTIRKGSSQGASAYQEVQSKTTNDYGHVSLQVGEGTFQSGSFEDIDWGTDSYWLQVELDLTGGTNYSVMGVSQLLSVPYALHAKTVDVAKVAFHASANADQSVTPFTYDTLHCDNITAGENFATPLGVFDINTYAFIAPTDGVYFFQAAAMWDSITDTYRCGAFFRVNHTDEVGSWTQSAGAGGVINNNLSTTLRLSAGDEVRLRIYNGDIVTRSTFTGGGSYCFFSGHLIFEE